MTQLVSSAQNDNEPKKTRCSCGFSNIFQLGVLQGEHKSSFAIQNIAGMRYKTWFAGIGAGMDYYYIRGFPVFVDVRKNILQRASSPFIYTDLGIHFAWGPERDLVGSPKSDYNNGLYYDVGIGYKASIKRNTGFVFSAGYTYKYVRQMQNTIQYCPFVGPCQEGYNIYKYDLRRLSLKVGWQF
jgi:hypothetical protein